MTWGARRGPQFGRSDIQSPHGADPAQGRAYSPSALECCPRPVQARADRAEGHSDPPRDLHMVETFELAPLERRALFGRQPAERPRNRVADFVREGDVHRIAALGVQVTRRPAGATLEMLPPEQRAAQVPAAQPDRAHQPSPHVRRGRARTPRADQSLLERVLGQVLTPQDARRHRAHTIEVQRDESVDGRRVDSARRRAAQNVMPAWMYLAARSGALLLLADAPHGHAAIQRVLLSSLLAAQTLHVWGAAAGLLLTIGALALATSSLMFTFAMALLPTPAARRLTRSLVATMVLAPVLGTGTFLAAFLGRGGSRPAPRSAHCGGVESVGCCGGCHPLGQPPLTSWRTVDAMRRAHGIL